MTVLIVGAGLIGSHIAKSCISSGKAVIMIGFHLEYEYIHKVSNLDQECMLDVAINSKEQILAVFNKYSIEKVVVAAGSMHQNFQKHAGAAIANEARLLLSVYEACVTNPPKQLIYISSLAVYGAELDRFEDQLPIPASAYGISKLYSEQLMSRLSQGSNISVHILRPAGVLGPNPPRSGNWMSKAINQLFIKETPNLHSLMQFNQDIESIDVRDLANFVVKLLQSDRKSSESLVEILNIGPGEMLSPSQLRLELEQIFQLNQQTYSVDVATSQPLPIQKANKLYGYVPQYTFSDSLLYIAQYYGREYANNSTAATIDLGRNIR